MKARIGVPRALLYYNYYPAWEAFFNSLGQEVVLSGKTNKKILDQGVRVAVDETCLPVKLAFGHLIDLQQRGVDYIFLPRLVSVEPRRYLCPKFLGLPDMALSLIPGLPPLIDPVIDLHHHSRHWRVELERAVREIAPSHLARRRAINSAVAAYKIFRKKLQAGLTPLEALEEKQAMISKFKLRVAVLGHPYNINDRFTSMNLLQRLWEMGVRPVTLEMLSQAEILEGESELEKESFWTFGKEILGAANHLLKLPGIDGAIMVVSFGCGPDSLIKDLIERRYRQAGKPLLSLTIDEHTGEAGLITRVEAFIDMLEHKKVALG